MSAEPEAPPVVAGYTIRRPLAQGGMGSVYEAVHDTLDRRVALKVLQQRYAEDEAFADRFLREARIAAKIDHPGVVTVHDAGRDAGGRLYLAMGFVEGGDLADWLREPSPLIESDVLRIGVRCAEALAVIHAQDLIHRDIKPDNILMSPAGDPVITDLGLARSQGGDDRMTATGQVLGTPAYMSPEQVTGDATIDHRTDIYSLGATLFALLAGRPPFRGDTPWATVAAIIKDAPPTLRELRPGTSAPTETLIASCLAKDPAARPASAAELAVELQRCADQIGAGRSGTQATMIAAEPKADSEAVPAVGGPSAGKPPTGATLAVVIGGAALVVIAGLIGALVAAVGGDDAPAGGTDEPEPIGAEMEPRSAPAADGPKAPKQGGGRLAGSTREDAADAQSDIGDEPKRPEATTVGGGISSTWSRNTGGLVELVAGELTELEPAVREALTDAGLSVTEHEIDGGIAQIEGEIDGKEYRVKLIAREVGSELVIESGFPRNEDRQQRIRGILDPIFGPADEDEP